MEHKLEVCVESVESACNAESGGASRIELCQCLAVGGLTPSIGLLREVKKAVTIPVFVLIRPRAGDFVYTKEEEQVMTTDIEAALENKADGIVIGALNLEGDIDVEMCKRLIDCTRNVPVTFHRAFDASRDLNVSLEKIIQLGCKRLITSGGEENAFIGRNQIKSLVQNAKGRIIVVPAGGVNEENIATILKETKASEFHSSASLCVECKFQNQKFHKMFGSTYLNCSTKRVSELLRLAKETL